MAGKALRFAVPLSEFLFPLQRRACLITRCILEIGSSSLYPPLTGYGRNESILPDPCDAVEAETRINAWWCAYTVERFIATTSAWPMAYEDEDVTALLPLTYPDFEAGVSVLHSHNIIHELTLISIYIS
jgi:hypothetical protein